MEVTLLGIVIDSNEEQLENAYSSIVVTVEGIITDVIPWHHENALAAIDVILLANVITHGLDVHNEQQPAPELFLQTTVPTTVGNAVGAVGAGDGIGVGLPST
jgi:hypothetical protein